jgi:hypothetical protein
MEMEKVKKMRPHPQPPVEMRAEERKPQLHSANIALCNVFLQQAEARPQAAAMAVRLSAARFRQQCCHHRTSIVLCLPQLL